MLSDGPQETTAPSARPMGGGESGVHESDRLPVELNWLGQRLSSDAEWLAQTHPAGQPPVISPWQPVPTASSTWQPALIGLGMAGMVALSMGIWWPRSESEVPLVEGLRVPASSPNGVTPDRSRTDLSASMPLAASSAVLTDALPSAAMAARFLEDYLELDGSLREGIADLEQEGKLDPLEFSL